jgi:diguanylate cyclase
MDKTVLVIEDENMLRENLVSLLTHEGFLAVGAANGIEGLEQAKCLMPQLILCDVMMPVLDGYGVLQALRQDPQMAMIPFIFLSGQVDRDQIRQGMNLGADDYLAKPLVKAELIQAIHSRLKKQQIVQQAQSQQLLQQSSQWLPVQSVPIGADAIAVASFNAIDFKEWAPAPPLGAIEPSWPSRSVSIKPWDAMLPSAPKDLLTGLPNRQAFLQMLKGLLERAQQYEQMIVLFSLNVRRFGSINTAFGYGVGDELLRQLADRLATTVASHGLVGRSNGDEFLVVLDELFWEEDAQNWAGMIHQACIQPFQVAGREILIHVSLGGACGQSGQVLPEQLLLQADMARLVCEEQGQLPYVFHDPPSAEWALEQRLLETELNRAILQDEFQVYYQPQITLHPESVGTGSVGTGSVGAEAVGAGAVTGVEALLRWRHPCRGMVAPDRFIAIAEASGLIVPIGEWVLRTACAQVKRWQALSPQPLKLSVNLAMQQLRQENFVEQVTRILQVTDLHPCQLTLELTETTLMADMQTAIQTLSALRQLGVRIAIDDFGKGYSSLHYLSQLPIDILKIDQSFVQRILVDHNASAIITAILTMAHELNLTTVAEGVETLEQARFLRAHGCQTLQGHLYSPALPAVELEHSLQSVVDRPVGQILGP